jgi:hypothetical protein
VNVTDILKQEFPEEELKVHENVSWSVPFKIEHGRGVLKLDVRAAEKEFADKAEGRSRYFPVNALAGRMGKYF